MKAHADSLSELGTDVPYLPDFSRIPFRAPEDATYRDDGPPRAANNPLYLAVPGPRSPGQVRKLIEANNPHPDLGIRRFGAEMRRERIDDVDGVLTAMRRHVKLEEAVMCTIRNSYVSRPWSDLYIQNSAALAHSIETGRTVSSNTGLGSVGSGALFGEPGLGKSVSLKSILMGCPQTIRHKSFRGRPIGLHQIVWIYLSMPPKASAYGLMVWISSILDHILGTSYLQEVENARNHTARVRIVASKLAIHPV